MACALVGDLAVERGFVAQVERLLLEMDGFALVGRSITLRSPARTSTWTCCSTIAEYALRDHTAPIQISEYRTQPLPQPYRDALPPAERIAARLRELSMPAEPDGDA